VTAVIAWILAVAFGCALGAVVLTAVVIATSHDRDWP
jgi:hypothetical protein